VNEKNYSAYLLELAAAAWSIDHFSVYLLGRHFELYTDHKPLETLSKIHKKTLNRLQEQMLEYDFKINYKKGLLNSAADALSRNVVMTPTDKFIATMSDDSGDIVTAQKNDPLVADVRNYLLKNILPDHSLGYRSKIEKIGADCFIENDIVWLVLRRPGKRTHTVLLCPQSLRQIVLDVAHCSFTGGHSGKQRTVDRLELAYWWPGITYDVDLHISKCIRCQEIAGRKPVPSPLQSLPICEEPNFRVHMDLFGPLRVRSASGKKYIMVITDAFSKYTELAAIEDKTANTVAKCFFEKWICRHGVPRTIVSDRGKEFLNSVMKDLCMFMGITHTATSAYHPQSNAQAETYNKTMIRYLSGMLDNSQTLDWEELLPAMMFCYNTHVQRSTLESPFFLTYAHSPRLPYFNLEAPRPLYGDSYISQAFTQLRLSFKRVRDNLEDARGFREEYFNRKAKDRSFSVGEQVLVRFPQVPTGVNPKFYKSWKGPYRVVKVLSRLNLQVQAGMTGKKLVVHVDRVRHLRLKDEQIVFDSNKDSLDLYGEKEQNRSLGAEMKEDAPVRYFSYDHDFGNFMEENDDEADESAPLPSDVSEGRVTRGRAGRENLSVEDYPLPVPPFVLGPGTYSRLRTWEHFSTMCLLATWE